MPFRSALSSIFTSSIYYKKLGEVEKKKLSQRRDVIVSYGKPGQKFSHASFENVETDDNKKEIENDEVFIENGNSISDNKGK